MKVYRVDQRWSHHRRFGYRLSLMLITIIGLLVPRRRRSDWRREWRAELWHYDDAETTTGTNGAPRTALLQRSLGSVRHAIWLRRRDWRQGMLRNDVRYALRNLIKTPGFTALAIATLAVGIGTSTAVFSLVNGILLQPYPYAEPERLVRVRSVVEESGDAVNVSFPDFLDLAAGSTRIAGLAAVDREPYNLGGGETAAYVQGAQVSASLFDVLGTTLVLGRGFQPGEDVPGGPNVVLLGEALWRASFAADPAIVGKQVSIDAEPYTVIGVVPVGGGYPDEASLWVPLRIDPGAQRRGNRWANVIARLAPEATLAQAQAEASALAGSLGAEYPDTNEGVGVRLISLYESRTGDFQGMMALLLGAVGFVLLIVCANLANLMLTRAVGRERELAVRAAMGASRLRIVRQLTSESALLAAAGAALGLLLGTWVVRILVAMVPVAIPEWVDFGIDGRVLAFAAGVSALALLLFGLAPAIGASADLSRALKETAAQGTGTVRKRRTRAALVIAEVALSIVLLVGAGLMISSLLRVAAVDPGYDTERSFMLTTAFAETRYGAPEQRLDFYRQARDRLLALPGVAAVGGIAQPPLRGGWNFMELIADAPAAAQVATAGAFAHAVTPGYIDAAGIELRRGRDLRDTDSAPGAPEVALVNDVLAERVWPGEDPIGKRIRFEFMDENAWIEVVGLVGGTRQVSLEEAPAPEIFYPYERWASFYGRITWMVRAAGEPAAAMSAAREVIRDLDPDQAVYDLMTLGAAVDESIWDVRFFTTLFWIFGAVALLLAAVGIYGLVAYGVSQRSHEIGVRMAMGAGSGDVLKMVLRHGLLLAATGAVLGFAGALALSALLAGALYQVSPTDPIVYLGVALLLGLVALVASVVPALRATRVDPVVALSGTPRG
jgi:putative ABC transport system permease protein